MSRHPWAVSPVEARHIQTRLASEVETVDRLPPLRTVAGVDVGFEDSGRTTRAAVAVLRWSDLTPVASRVLRRPTRFPYIPGLLSFREVPALLEVLNTLDSMPDIILCDGQGRAHPRRFGVACHLGVATGLATIGVAKSRLCGHHGRVPQERGRWCALEESGETIGAVLRTRKGVKPVYVSPGHRVSLVTAVRLVMACCTRYRLPETTRHAHRLASSSAV